VAALSITPVAGAYAGATRTSLRSLAAGSSGAGTDDSAPDTVQLSGSIVEDDSQYGSGTSEHCSQKWILIISVPSDVSRYTASVYQPGVGQFSFSGPPFTNPIIGFGSPYTMPQGQAGWFLGGDSGPGECEPAPPNKYIDIQATGYITCSSDSVTDGSELDVGAHLAGAILPAARTCPLTVTITAVGSSTEGVTGLAGLSYDQGYGPIFVDQSTERCVTGCTDLVIRVTDPKNHNSPVNGASVDVILGHTQAATPAFSYPAGSPPSPYLCNFSGGNCGTNLTGLRTANGGKVIVQYWTPGLLGAATSDVTATARAAGGACGCDQRFGKDPNALVTANYHLIFQSKGTLTERQVESLTEWVAHPGLLGYFIKGAKGTYGYYIEKLAKTEEEFEKLSEAGERFFGALELAEINKTFWEQDGILAELLTDLNLSGTGLGDPPRDRVVSVLPGRSFQDQIVEEASISGSTHPGFMWVLGETLRALQEAHSSNYGPQALVVKVWEVSYCDQDHDCDGEYMTSSDIHPYLDIYLSAASGGNITKSTSFIIPYNANAWMLTQSTLAGPGSLK